jgi:hypothetical protein
MSSDSEEECLKELLGGITFDAVEWQEEEEEDQHLANTDTSNLPVRPSTCTTARVVLPPAYEYDETTAKNDDDSSTIFLYAYQSTSTRVGRPPLQVVDLTDESKGGDGGRGNGLVATQGIPRGTVIYTERAAAATQLPSPSSSSSSIHACQYCFQSLEPISKLSSEAMPLPCPELWPIPELVFFDNDDSNEEQEENNSNLKVDKYGRVQCSACQTLCCSSTCYEKLCEEEYGSCCVLARVQQAVERFDTTVQAPVALAGRLLAHSVHYYRTHHESLKGHFLQGICGTADNLSALELGLFQKEENVNDDGYSSSYTLEPLHNDFVFILELTTPDEKRVFSLEYLHTLAAQAGRNGFGLLTQSPFKPYHAGLLRKNGRDSPRHNANMQQVAQSLSGKDQLERGMDREIEAKVAPELCAIFPLTARCNHSCEPNAKVQSQEFVDARIDVVAKRDISAGEEILISYIGGDYGSGMGKKATFQRRRELQAKYMFLCDCPLCTYNITPTA